MLHCNQRFSLFDYSDKHLRGGDGDKITDASIEVSMEWVLTHAESDITPTERRVSTR